MQIVNYPTQYELEEVLTSITNRAFLNQFAQSHGIFITHVSHEQLASEISHLFLDDEDLESIRREAYQIRSNHALSGFVVKSEDKNFDLTNVYQWILTDGEHKQTQTLSGLTKVSGEDGLYKSTLEYNKKRAGRVQFLQDEVNSFDFYIKKLSDGEWQVEIDSNRSTDIKELQSLLYQGLNKEDTIVELEQKLLTPETSITFFDSLAKSGMDDNWRFLDIKHLTLKMGNDHDEAETEEIKEHIEEVRVEELTGITQAILQGQNLRENSFVKQSVASGYRFNAMTYEFENINEPVVIQVKAEFKGRPKVFEVSITSYQNNTGTAGVRVASSSKDGEKQLRSGFWNRSKEVFNKLVIGARSRSN